MTNETDPAQRVAAIDSRAHRFETPCGDGTMVWRRWGDGPELVLLHGGSGSWLHWIRNIEDFARDFTVWAPDLPGLGDSATPPAPHRAESIAAIMADGLERLIPPPTPVRIAGFSYGGITGGHVAASLGARLEALVLIGAEGLGVPISPTFGPLKSWRRVADEAARAQVHRDNLAELMFADAANIDDLAVFVQSEVTAKARIVSRDDSRSSTLLHALGHVRGRVAAIWGEFDALGRGALETRQDVIRSVQPDARFRVISGAGHWAHYEAAARFNETLRELIAR